MITIGAYRLTDIWRAFLRRMWLLVLAVGLIAPVALAVAYFLPPKYRAEGRILVESQQIAGVESTVTRSAVEQLERIRQKLMTRQQLLDLIAKFDLYADRTDLSPTEKVELVRDNTEVEPIALPGSRGTALLSFIIAFTATDGQTSARVANELVDAVISENVRTRTDLAEGTLTYFQDEVDTLSGRLSETEAEITRFVNANQGLLPDSLDFRREELANVQERQFQRAQNRLGLVERMRGLEATLRGERPAQLLDDPQTPQGRQLLVLRNRLIERQSVLSDTHPEIVGLKRRIAALEAAVAPADDTETGPAAIARARLAEDIALIQKEIELLDGQQAEDDAYKAQLVASIAATPEVGMEVNRLERRRGQLQTQYNDAVARLAAAREGAALEDKKQGERFEVAEPPQVPTRPFSPNRPLIAAGGVVFSIMVGLGLMVLFELLNSSIRTAHALEYRTGLRPVVTIPYIRTRGERRMRLLRWIGLALLIAVAIPGLLYAVDQFYLPLGAMAERLSDQLGIDGLIRIIEIRLGR